MELIAPPLGLGLSCMGAWPLADITQAGAPQIQDSLSILLVLKEKSLTSLGDLVIFYLLGKETGPEASLAPSFDL